MIGRLIISVTISSLAGYLYLITFNKVVESNTLKLFAVAILFGINLLISFFIFIPVTATIKEKNKGISFPNYLLIFLVAGFVLWNIMVFIWGWLATGNSLVFYTGNKKYFLIYLITGYICYLSTSIIYASTTYNFVRKGHQ